VVGPFDPPGDKRELVPVTAYISHYRSNSSPMELDAKPKDTLADAAQATRF